MNVGQVAEALLITGFGSFSSAEVVCAAAAVVGNRVSVHVSRTFSVRGGQTAPAEKHCISSEGFIPGGDGFLSPGDTFDFGRSDSTLDGDHFLMDEPLHALLARAHRMAGALDGAAAHARWVAAARPRPPRAGPSPDPTRPPG